MDVLLDWEDELRDYEQAVELSDICEVDGGVSLCLGTSLQISPSKDLPAKASKMVCTVPYATVCHVKKYPAMNVWGPETHHGDVP